MNKSESELLEELRESINALGHEMESHVAMYESVADSLKVACEELAYLGKMFQERGDDYMVQRIAKAFKKMRELYDAA